MRTPFSGAIPGMLIVHGVLQLLYIISVLSDNSCQNGLARSKVIWPSFYGLINMGITKQAQCDSLLPGYFALAKSRHKMPPQTETLSPCSRFILFLFFILLLFFINERNNQLSREEKE